MALSKQQFAANLAKRMGTDEKTALAWVDAYTETLLESFEKGEGVTITNLGGFYCERKRDSTAFKFNPSQRLRAILGWSSTYKG